MAVDGRIVVVGTFLAALWVLCAAGQRWDTRLPRVAIPRAAAALTGSRSSCVIWRALAIQVGLVFDFVLYAAILLLAGSASFANCGLLSLLLMALILWFDPNNDCREI